MEHLRDAARTRAITLISIHVERGDGLFAWKRVMDQLRAGQAEAVLMISSRHLAHRLPLTQRELLLYRVRELGCAILTLEELRSPGRERASPSAPPFRHLNRAQLRRRQKHATGGYAYGAPPYGWRASDKRLVPN